MNYKNAILSLALLMGINILNSSAILAMKEKKEDNKNIPINNRSIIDWGYFKSLSTEMQREIFKYLFSDYYIKNLGNLDNLIKLMNLALDEDFKNFLLDNYSDKIEKIKNKLGKKLIKSIVNASDKGSLYENSILDFSLTKKIINSGKANLNTQNDLGLTPLMAASSVVGDIEVLKLLLAQKGIDVNIQMQDGTTALMLASGIGNENGVKLLLNQKDIDVNIQDEDGDTAFDKAANNEHEKIVELLLKAGSDGFTKESKKRKRNDDFE